MSVSGVTPPRSSCGCASSSTSLPRPSGLPAPPACPCPRTCRLSPCHRLLWLPSSLADARSLCRLLRVTRLADVSGEPACARPCCRLWGPDRAPRGGRHGPRVELSAETSGTQSKGLDLTCSVCWVDGQAHLSPSLSETEMFLPPVHPLDPDFLPQVSFACAWGVRARGTTGVCTSVSAAFRAFPSLGRDAVCVLVVPSFWC